MRGDHHELLAAVARRQVGRPDRRPEDGRRPPQGLVAGGVAVGVVDPLEVVEVGDPDGQRTAVPLVQAPLGGQPLFQGQAVGQAGQAVDVGACSRSSWSRLVRRATRMRAWSSTMS